MLPLIRTPACNHGRLPSLTTLRHQSPGSQSCAWQHRPLGSQGSLSSLVSQWLPLAACSTVGLLAERRRSAKASLSIRQNGAVQVKASTAGGSTTVSKRKTWARLFTKEDKGRVHAILGLTCLAHIITRYVLLVCGIPDMGFTGDVLSLLCIALHILLGMSSFRFRVPKRRSKDGTQIWQEYRAHNLIFTLRALSGMLCAWAEARYNIERLWFVRLFALYAGMFAADAVTKSYALPKTTLQGAMSPTMRAFLASFQFIGAASLLFSNGFWQNFHYVVAVQLTAFFLTLRRRRMISPAQVVSLYAALILVPQPFLFLEQFKFQDMAIPFWGTIAFLLRVPLGMNKYVLWTGTIASMWFWNQPLLLSGAGAGHRVWL